MTNTTTIYGNVTAPRIKEEIINAVEGNDIFGVRFPLYDKNNTAKGIFIKTKGIELLKSELRQLINTERGERVMLPNFGLSLRRFLFEPITEDLIVNLRKEIFVGVSSYIPEARITRLTVGNGDNIRSTGLPGILVSLTVSSRITKKQADITFTL